MNRQNSKKPSSQKNNISKHLNKSNSENSKVQEHNPKDQEPKLHLKLEKQDYYEGETINGTLKIKFEQPFSNFLIYIQLLYKENYVLFDENGETALLTKLHKKVLSVQEINCTHEPHQPGEYFYSFSIQIPEKVEAATFYHQGKTLSARINYYIKARIIEKANPNDEEAVPQIFKEKLAIKINRYQKYVTINKILCDEQTVSKFLCFGGGLTSIEAEYCKDTYCIAPEKLALQNVGGPILNSSLYGNDQDFEGGDKECIIEMKFEIDNSKNRMKIDEVIVQLLQIVAIKDIDDTARDNKKKIIQHVQEVLYIQKQDGVYSKDRTDPRRVIKINLQQLQKQIIKRQQKEGIYGNLSKEESSYAYGLQQTSTGEYIENFYMLRVKAIVNQDLWNSPYVDQQIFFCYHNVPITDLDQSQVQNIQQAPEDRQVVQVQEEKQEPVKKEEIQVTIHQQPKEFKMKNMNNRGDPKGSRQFLNRDDAENNV